MHCVKPNFAQNFTTATCSYKCLGHPFHSKNIIKLKWICVHGISTTAKARVCQWMVVPKDQWLQGDSRIAVGPARTSQDPQTFYATRWSSNLNYKPEAEHVYSYKRITNFSLLPYASFASAKANLTDSPKTLESPCKIGTHRHFCTQAKIGNMSWMDCGQPARQKARTFR